MAVRLARGEEWTDIEQPANREHFIELIGLAIEVVRVCEGLGIDLVVSGSLAVLAYTGSPDLVVDDIDLSCSENEFERLSAALSAGGFDTRITPWHVLQARRCGLKIEFDASEHWMTGLTGDFQLLDLGGAVIRVIGPGDLRELYRRGIHDLERRKDAASYPKLAHVRSRYDRLMQLDPSGGEDSPPAGSNARS